ncbi:outer membrane porin protein C [Escherichia coli]|uniref:Outer membrane porin protein C n=1 Tax=Escherichia coli TaxID=562 RepID=A0A484X3L1_ECOLX|nr:outer membrane porin protein C [Escherichia coli]
MTNNGRGALRQNGDGVGGSITYDYEGFGIGGAISSSKRTDDQNSRCTSVTATVLKPTLVV